MNILSIFLIFLWNISHFGDGFLHFIYLNLLTPLVLSLTFFETTPLLIKIYLKELQFLLVFIPFAFQEEIDYLFLLSSSQLFQSCHFYQTLSQLLGTNAFLTAWGIPMVSQGLSEFEDWQAIVFLWLWEA